jgi:hypothetical protein
MMIHVCIFALGLSASLWISKGKSSAIGDSRCISWQKNDGSSYVVEYADYNAIRGPIMTKPPTLTGICFVGLPILSGTMITLFFSIGPCIRSLRGYRRFMILGISCALVVVIACCVRHVYTNWVNCLLMKSVHEAEANYWSTISSPPEFGRDSVANMKFKLFADSEVQYHHRLSSEYEFRSHLPWVIFSSKSLPTFSNEKVNSAQKLKLLFGSSGVPGG